MMKIYVPYLKVVTRNALILIAGLSFTVYAAPAFATEDVQVDGATENGGNSNQSDGYDTEYVEELTLPRAAAPVVTGSNIQSTTTVGKNTQAVVNTPPGTNTQANLGFFGTLSISVGSRTNAEKLDDADGPASTDTSIIIVPQLLYRGALNNRHIYEFSVTSAVENFDVQETLDTKNLVFAASIALDLTDKLKADLYATHLEGSEPRNSSGTRQIDADTVNDERTEDTVGGRVTIGRRTNTLQFVLGAEHADLDYTNNNQNSRDRTNDRLLAGAYYNLGPKTSTFVNVTQDDINYKEATSSEFDSTNTSVNVGVGWEPSYTTSLLLQVGETQKEYEDSGFDDQDTNTYLGKLSWLPNENSTINLYASRQFEESTNISSPVTISTLTGISLAHAFTNAISGQAYLNFIDDELVDVRTDDVTDYGLGIYYNFTRWLALGLKWDRTERESSDPAFSYDSDYYGLAINITGAFKLGGRFGKPEIQTSDGLNATSP